MMFYPAINMDHRSLRLRTSQFGRSLKGKVIIDDRYALADYRLYVFQNREQLKQVESDLIDTANMLYDIAQGLTDDAASRYRSRDNAWRWTKHRRDERDDHALPSIYSGLQDYLVTRLKTHDMKLQDRNVGFYKHERGQREVIGRYIDWAENSYLPDNWIGSLRLRMKSIPLFFYEAWYDTKEWNNPYRKAYDFLDRLFHDARRFYQQSYKLAQLQQYQQDVIYRINAELSEYYDAINLIRTLRRLYDEPYFNHDKPTAQEIDEMLFEMGMDDALPHWDPDICQRCDGQGQLNQRRCSTCSGYGYHNPLRLYPVLYPGSYGVGKLKDLNLESKNPFLFFGRNNDTITSGLWGNTLRELPFPDDIDQLLDKAESINSRDD